MLVSLWIILSKYVLYTYTPHLTKAFVWKFRATAAAKITLPLDLAIIEITIKAHK